MYVLECGKYASIARWSKDGKSFVVIDPKAFEINVLPSLFKTSQFESFVRKLCRWGFAKRSGTACRFGMMPTSIWFCHPAFQKGKFALCSTDVRCNSKVDSQASRTLLNLAEDETHRSMFPQSVDFSRRNTMHGASALDDTPSAAGTAYNDVNDGRRRMSAPQSLNASQRSLAARQENPMCNPSMTNASSMPGLYEQRLLAQQQQHQSLANGNHRQQLLRSSQMDQRQLLLEDPSTMSLLNPGSQQNFSRSANPMLQHHNQNQGNTMARGGQGLLQQHQQELFLAELERIQLAEQRNMTGQRNMSSSNTQALEQELMLMEYQRKNTTNRSRNLNAPQPPNSQQDMLLLELRRQNLMHMQNQRHTKDYSRSSMRG
jgi:hypothetical protein